MNYDENLQTGIRVIDEQHKELIKLLSQFCDMRHNPNPEALSIVLNETLEFCKYHFSTEEVFLEDYPFEERNRHKLLHNDFINYIVDIYDKHENKGLSRKQLGDFCMYLRDWIEKHMIEEDLRVFKGGLNENS
jgi:hemerythrin